MEKEEAQGWALIIAIAYVGLMMFLIWLQLVFIQLARFMFWACLGIIPLGFLGVIIFFIMGIFAEEDFYGNSNKWIYYFLAIILFVAFIFSIFNITDFYNQGYSNEVLEKEAELRNQLQAYQDIMDIITLQKFIDIENQVLEETINSLCQTTPNYPCAEMKQSLQVYEDIVGLKNQADDVAKTFGFFKKAVKNTEQS